MDSTHYNPRKLVEARELQGKTQQQIADILNVDRQTIYRAEAGKSVSFELLAQLCRHYQMPVTGVIVPFPETASL
jgi:transcriptional regulator with XRE-family HTH domain